MALTKLDGRLLETDANIESVLVGTAVTINSGGVNLAGAGITIRRVEDYPALDISINSNIVPTAQFNNGGGSCPATVHIIDDGTSANHYGLFVGGGYNDFITNPVLITKSNLVGIGTTNPSGNLHITTSTSTRSGVILKGGSATTTIGSDYATVAIQNTNNTNNNYSTLGFLDDEGNYGITLNAVYVNHRVGFQTSYLSIRTRSNGLTNEAVRIGGLTRESNGIYFYSERDLSISPTDASVGRLVIGGIASSYQYQDRIILNHTGTTGLIIRGGSSGYTHGHIGLIASSSGNAGGNQRGLGVYMYDEPSASEWYIGRPYGAADQLIFARKSSPTYRTQDTAQTTNSLMTLTSAGNLTIVGALSKGSGSFKIDHPLPGLSTSHHLVHSFIEGPQSDLIYRGKTTLVSGISTINIDNTVGMTEGTFEVLCREIQCFTSNETGWCHVRGTVTGNMLTIEAQDNTCNDTISWMVIGERKDPHMYDTEWTDENGKVIVEPEKLQENNVPEVSYVPVIPNSYQHLE